MRTSVGFRLPGRMYISMCICIYTWVAVIVNHSGVFSPPFLPCMPNLWQLSGKTGWEMWTWRLGYSVARRMETWGWDMGANLNHSWGGAGVACVSVQKVSDVWSYKRSQLWGEYQTLPGWKDSLRAVWPSEMQILFKPCGPIVTR